MIKQIVRVFIPLAIIALPFIFFMDLPIRLLWNFLPNIEMQSVMQEAARNANQILYLKRDGKIVPPELNDMVICDCKTKKMVYPHNAKITEGYLTPCISEPMTLFSFSRTWVTSSFTEVTIQFLTDDLQGKFAITYKYPGVVDPLLNKYTPWVIFYFIMLYNFICLVLWYAWLQYRVKTLLVKSITQVNEQRLNFRLRMNTFGTQSKIFNLFNEMMARLEEAFQVQRSFVSHASHELRTPLTSIISQLEVTLVNERPISEYKKLLSSILDDVRGISKLVQALLDMARTTADPSVIQFSTIRIDEVLWQCLSDLLKQKPNYNIDIQLSELPELDNALDIIANEQMLKSVIINLMDNGCKFSPDNKVIVNVVLTEQTVILQFTDNGIGIERDELEKIFTPFYRSRNSNQVQGNGIGLLLSRRIVVLHRGSLTIDSEFGKWTKVIVSIPRNNLLTRK